MATVLITGCSTGFGYLSALRFARAGDTVVATMRDTTKGSDLERIAKEEDLRLEVRELDVTDDASVAEATRGLEVDVLVNNAGIGIHGAIEEIPLDDAKAIFDTNVFGVMRVTQAVLPGMRARRTGVIVNVSSIAGIVTPPFGGVYSASKYALEAISEALHMELGVFGIRVAVIEPGGFETHFDDNRQLVPAGSAYADLDAKWATASGSLPGRDEPSDPQDVADAIYEAATQPDHPLRRLVGADAQLIGQLRKELGDAEFEHTMRTALNFWDGARQGRE